MKKMIITHSYKTDQDVLEVLSTKYPNKNNNGEVLYQNVCAREEADYKHFLSSYTGYVLISQRFISFFCESLGESIDHIKLLNTPDQISDYSIALSIFESALQRFLAAKFPAVNGYPLESTGLLRDLMDTSLVIAGALALKSMSWRELDGVIIDGRYYNRHDSKSWSVKEKLESKIKTDLLCSFHDKYPSYKVLLKSVRDLYNNHIHGSRIGRLVCPLGWTFGLKGDTPMAPMEEAVSIFINLSLHASWMWHRLLPLLQPPSQKFNDSWAQRWQVLDEAFHYYLTKNMENGRNLPRAIIDLINFSFPFRHDYIYSKS